jgi:hypothetical protein
MKELRSFLHGGESRDRLGCLVTVVVWFTHGLGDELVMGLTNAEGSGATRQGQEDNKGL